MFAGVRHYKCVASVDAYTLMRSCCVSENTESQLRFSIHLVQMMDRVKPHYRFEHVAPGASINKSVQV